MRRELQPELLKKLTRVLGEHFPERLDESRAAHSSDGRETVDRVLFIGPGQHPGHGARQSWIGHHRQNRRGRIASLQILPQQQNKERSHQSIDDGLGAAPGRRQFRDHRVEYTTWNIVLDEGFEDAMPQMVKEPRDPAVPDIHLCPDDADGLICLALLLQQCQLVVDRSAQCLIAGPVVGMFVTNPNVRRSRRNDQHVLQPDRQPGRAPYPEASRARNDEQHANGIDRLERRSRISRNTADRASSNARRQRTKKSVQRIALAFDLIRFSHFYRHKSNCTKPSANAERIDPSPRPAFAGGVELSSKRKARNKTVKARADSSVRGFDVRVTEIRDALPRCSDINSYDDRPITFHDSTTGPSGNALILRHVIRFGRTQRFPGNLIGWPVAGIYMG